MIIIAFQSCTCDIFLKAVLLLFFSQYIQHSHVTKSPDDSDSGNGHILENVKKFDETDIYARYVSSM